MDISKVIVGNRYSYYPPSKVGENLHFPAVVEAVGKTVKVRLTMNGDGNGVVRHVHAWRLSDQADLL